MGKQIISWLSNFIAAVQFWWAKKRIKIDRDFMVKRGPQDTPIVIITRGEFSGVSFSVSHVSLKEEQTIEFCTTLLVVPDGVDITSNKLFKLTTNIFRILLNDIVAETPTREVDNENRTDDTPEFDEEREVCEEVAPVPESRVSKRKPRKKALSDDRKSPVEVQSPTKSRSSKNSTTRKKRPNGK